MLDRLPLRCPKSNGNQSVSLKSETPILGLKAHVYEGRIEGLLFFLHYCSDRDLEDGFLTIDDALFRYTYLHSAI